MDEALHVSKKNIRGGVFLVVVFRVVRLLSPSAPLPFVFLRVARSSVNVFHASSSFRLTNVPE